MRGLADRAATRSLNSVGERHDRHCRLCLGRGLENRRPGVGSLAQGRIERDAAEQRHADLVGEPLAAARSEDLLPGADEVRHVLGDTDDAEAHLLCHSGRPHRDLLRGRLRGRHDEHLRPGQQLAERDRDVPRPGWHVDDERVQLAPVDVREKLFECPVEHRAAPHHRGVVIEEEADRHQLQIASHGRHDHRVDDDGPLLHAEHVRDRVAVDVGVEHPDAARPGRPVPQRCSPSASTCRHRPCRTRSRGRASSDASEIVFSGRPPRSRVESAAFSSAAHDVEMELDGGHTLDGADEPLHLVLERGAHRAARDGQRDGDLHVTAVVDRRRRAPCRAR